ncbi:MAG: tetratricopeptide repeat protein [Oscillospiraceae bacterium]|nr:tetratricopeptide repeat protein [Oscillospiraceae bacterium]
MKKLLSFILSLAFVLCFTACGSKATAGWQEHYDLGIKYVNEARYEEAILSFTKALEIDPKQAPVYIALAEAYVRQGDYTSARATLDKAVTEIGQTDELSAAIEKVEQATQPEPTPEPQPTPSPTPQEDLPVPHHIPEAEGVVNTRRTDNDDGSYYIEEFDADGKVLRRLEFDTKGRYDYLYTFEYYPDGTVKTEFKYKYHITSVSLNITTFDENGQKLWGNNTANVNATAQPIFNGEGQPYSIITANIHGNTTTTDYNLFGDVIREDHRNADGSYAGLWTYEYDENGNKISDTSYDADGNINFQKFY